MTASSLSSSGVGGGGAAGDGDDERPDLVRLFAAFAHTGARFFEAGEYRKAVNCFSKALEISSQVTYVLCMRARCFLALDLFQLALVDAELALDIERSNPEALFLKAEALLALRSFGHALAFFQQAVDHDGSNEVYQQRMELCRAQLDAAPDSGVMARRLQPPGAGDAPPGALFASKRYLQLMCDLRVAPQYYRVEDDEYEQALRQHAERMQEKARARRQREQLELEIAMTTPPIRRPSLAGRGSPAMRRASGAHPASVASASIRRNSPQAPVSLLSTVTRIPVLDDASDSAAPDNDDLDLDLGLDDDADGAPRPARQMFADTGQLQLQPLVDDGTANEPPVAAPAAPPITPPQPPQSSRKARKTRDPERQVTGCNEDLGPYSLLLWRQQKALRKRRGDAAPTGALPTAAMRRHLAHDHGHDHHGSPRLDRSPRRRRPAAKVAASSPLLAIEDSKLFMAKVKEKLASTEPPGRPEPRRSPKVSRVAKCS